MIRAEKHVLTDTSGGMVTVQKKEAVQSKFNYIREQVTDCDITENVPFEVVTSTVGHLARYLGRKTRLPGSAGLQVSIDLAGRAVVRRPVQVKCSPDRCAQVCSGHGLPGRR